MDISCKLWTGSLYQYLTLLWSHHTSGNYGMGNSTEEINDLISSSFVRSSLVHLFIFVFEDHRHRVLIPVLRPAGSARIFAAPVSTYRYPDGTERQ